MYQAAGGAHEQIIIVFQTLQNICFPFSTFSFVALCFLKQFTGKLSSIASKHGFASCLKD